MKTSSNHTQPSRKESQVNESMLGTGAGIPSNVAADTTTYSSILSRPSDLLHEPYLKGTTDQTLMTNKEEQGMDELVEDESSEATSSEETEGTPSESDSALEVPWVSWYCKLPGHNFLLEVPEEFIDDDFNLTGLDERVPLMSEALDIILDYELDSSPPASRLEEIEASAEVLYGLIHQRYILTKQGMSQMLTKYKARSFGVCPRILCNNTFVIPCGLHDDPNSSRLKVYCPACMDLYTPSIRQAGTLDGACFGVTFPHLFISIFHSQIATINTVLSKNPDRFYAIYEPRIYGFRVHESALNGPRNQWLRFRSELLSAESREYFKRKYDS